MVAPLRRHGQTAVYPSGGPSHQLFPDMAGADVPAPSADHRRDAPQYFEHVIRFGCGLGRSAASSPPSGPGHERPRWLVLGQVFSCAAAEAMGRLGDDGGLHGLAGDTTSSHDSGSFTDVVSSVLRALIG